MKEIIFYPGPMHLFWTTGVYYLYDLSRHFEIILILDNLSEAHRTKVYRLRKCICNLKEVIFIDNTKRYLRSHLECKRIVKYVFDKYDPTYVFANNDIAKFNVYLLAQAKRRNCVSICFLAVARYLASIKLERRVIINWQIYKLRKKASLPLWICKYYIYGSMVIRHLFNYVIGPLLCGSKPFFGQSSAYLYRGAPGMRDGDYYIVYTNQEKLFALEDGTPKEKIKVFSNPVKRINTDLVHKTLYDNFSNVKTNNIVIFPTWGNTEYLIKKETGEYLLADSIYESWKGIITSLLEKFEDFKLIIKLHPVQEKDRDFKEYMATLKTRFDRIEVSNSAQSAVYYILISKIIVSENSTVLELARALDPAKIIISFNINKVLLGDIYKGCEDIYYFESLKELEECNFAKKIQSSLQLDRNKNDELYQFLKNLSANRNN